MSDEKDLNLDHLRDAEENNYQFLKELLGDSYNLLPELLRLYEVFIKLAVEPVFQLETISQPPAILHLLQWLKNEAVAGAITLMRGHIADSSNYSRRALEISAFVLKMYHDADSAASWMASGRSKRAQNKYLAAFPAYKLVRELLPADLVDMYEDDCLSVHPSFAGVSSRASLDPDMVHRFKFFDLDEADEKQTYFVLKFFQLCICHARIMNALAQTFASHESFDSAQWQVACTDYMHRLQEKHSIWMPAFEALLAAEEGETTIC